MRDTEPVRKFYITTPIYYVNAKPHIGSAYSTIAADVLARYHRLRGEEVFFLTGTDEHGAKVAQSAADRSLTPQEFVDEIVPLYKQMWERLHIQYDRFIRTTEADHVAAVQEVVRRLLASGDIYLSSYEGMYCVPCETYLRESELDEGRCPDCQRPVESVSQPAYFFRASRYSDRLLAYIEEHPEFIQPETRRHEVVAYVEAGLRDTCISRAGSEWDIPIPEAEGQSVYVWLDALINYLTAVGFPHQEDPRDRFWPPDVQLMAKDILTRFHATIWPALLMALEVPLPRRLFAHGYLVTAGGDKMSKSKGNVVDPWEAAKELADISGATTAVAVDAIRYFLMREFTFGLDGTYSTPALFGRFNADLANDLGNLLNRTLPLIARYREGLVPEPGPGAGGLAAALEQARERVEQGLEELDFRGVLEAIWELLSAANKFVDQREPWALYKAAKQVELDAVLYDCADCLRAVALFVWPFLPAVAAEIWERLGLQAAGIVPQWKDLEAGKLPAGLPVDAGQPLFPRIDLERAQQRLEGKAEKAAPAAEKPAKAEQAAVPACLTYDQFQQMELRVGKVLEVEKAPKSDKLYVLQVDLGEETPRQIVAGLAQDFPPEEILGKLVIVVANLAPATIRGQRSYGMLLAAGEAQPLALLTTDRECPTGSRIR
ncbi:MAG TPA: methionine--tRNA ligase [Armatimonadota bacterium]